MGFLDSMPIIGKLFSDVKDLADQAIDDGDLRAKLVSNLEEIKRQVEREIYLKELEVKTVPWVDALHKMGRQILNYAVLFYCVACVYVGHEITQYELLLIGGPNIAYQFVKGRGK
jgi:hypothetical protein